MASGGSRKYDYDSGDQTGDSSTDDELNSCPHRPGMSHIRNLKQELKMYLTESDSNLDTGSSSAVCTDSESESERGKENVVASRLADQLSKKISIAPVVYESRTELTPNDAEFQAEQCFGVTKVEEKPDEDQLFKPRLPTQICVRNSRYITCPSESKASSSGRVELPLGHDMPVQILCVDSNDVIHCRYHEEDIQDLTPGVKKEKHLVIATFPKLMRDMDLYYGNGKHQKSNRYGVAGDEAPVVGEIVVVKVYRCFQNKHLDAGYGLKKEFHRARVVALDMEEFIVTVNLLDDYGCGSVPLHNVFKLKQVFSSLPPQLFTCQLDTIGLFGEMKVLHKVLQTSPVPRTWRECSLNRAYMTFYGKYSEANRPLVDLSMRIISFPSEWVSLKRHMLKSLNDIMSPVSRLLEYGSDDCPQVCEVLRGDEGGNLWILLGEDKPFLALLEKTLEKLSSTYEDRLKNFRLEKDVLFRAGAGGNDKLKKNLNKIYVARVKKHPRDERGKLMRVRITSRSKRTNKVRVFCIDYAFERVVPIWELLPLEALCEDLCYLPSLAINVHLNKIKSLQVEHELVQEVYFGYELFIQFARDWPGSPVVPEVNLFLEGFDEVPQAELMRVSKADNFKPMTTASDIFVRYDVAEEFPKEDLERIYEELEKFSVREVKMEEKGKMFKEEYGKGCSFFGENFQFLGTMSPPEEIVIAPELLNED